MSEHSLQGTPPTEPADLVETLWERPGGGPDLKALLADHPHWSSHEIRDALLVDQQFRWRTSQPWTTEDYLALAPSLAADHDSTLDLIYGECRGRSRQGNPPNLEELVGRFPHLWQRLERQIEIASWFEDTGGSDSQPGEEDCAGEEDSVGEEDTTGEADAATIRFGDYELCEEIARGGMGVIYRARHRKLQRTVALKMIRPERLMRAADLRRFKNETRIIAQLDHPNIIPILHVDQVDGIHFFTMRMIQGRDLDVRRTDYLDDVRLAARLVRAVAAAIHHAHLHGVLHRDLKPSNVLVDESGVPFVVDFGLATHLADLSQLTRSDEFQGTPAYAAPELLREDAPPPTVAADVYGLGAILYVLITGQPPFSGHNSLDVWTKIRHGQPRPPRPLNARVDQDLEAICLKALEKNPAARYSSAAALAEDLDRYLAGEPVAARPVGRWRRRWRRLRRHPARAALTLAASVAFFGLLTVIAVQSLQLREEMKETRAARREADAHHQAMEVAQAQAERLQAEASADRRRARESLYVAEMRFADMARRTGDSMQLAQLLDRQVPGPGEHDVRGFEWFVLDRLRRAPSTRLEPRTLDEPSGPDAHERTLAFTPDGQYLAVPCQAGVRLWNVRTGKPERTLGRPASPCDHVAISPNGRLLVAAHTAAATVEVWDLGSNPDAPIWQVTDQPCNRLVFSPDSTLVIAVSQDRDELAMYAAATGQVRQQVPAKQCRAAAFSPDYHFLAFTVQDNVVLWDWPQRRQLRVLSGHVGPVTSLAFSPDRGTLATAGRDRRIKLWEPATGQLLRTMTSNTGEIRDIAFVENNRLDSTDDLGNLHVWHATQGQLLCTLRSAPRNPAHHLAVSPDAHHLALPLDNGQVELLDISRP